MDKIEKMFLDLNSVLVKFWKDQGRPDKEVKIALLERMLNWYKKMGYITLDTLSEEPDTPEFTETFEICLYDGRTPNKENCNECSTTCSVRKEESDKSLEEEISRTYHDGSVTDTEDIDHIAYENIAHHFAEWQASQMPMPEDTVLFNKGVAEGRRLEREDMMHDAVEGEVIKTDKHTSVRYKSFYGTDRYFYGIADKQFKPGDKVRIVVLKEEE